MLEELLAENHGVISRAQLLKNPFTSDEIQTFVRHGRIRLLRRGWYAGLVAHPDVERAVKAGGALSCVSALGLFGVWMPPGSCLHIRRGARFQADLQKTGLKDCQPRSGRARRIPWSVDPVAVALLSALQCVDEETAVVLLDSVAHRGLMTLDELQQLMVAARLPKRTRALLDKVDPAAESGIESFVRLRLRRRGIQLRTQVQIGNVARVDILVGDRLVIEVDGYEHHSSKEQTNADKERDRMLVALGYRVIRLTYDQVMTGWEAAMADISAAIRQRTHWWPRSRRDAEKATG